MRVCVYIIVNVFAYAYTQTFTSTHACMYVNAATSGTQRDDLIHINPLSNSVDFQYNRVIYCSLQRNGFYLLAASDVLVILCEMFIILCQHYFEMSLLWRYDFVIPRYLEKSNLIYFSFIYLFSTNCEYTQTHIHIWSACKYTYTLCLTYREIHLFISIFHSVYGWV